MTLARLLSFSLVALLLLPSTLLAEMYKYVDENGKVVYTDTPPPGKKSKKLDLKINTFSAPPEVSSLGNPPRQTAGATAGAAKVRMFTTTWCGYCKQARAYLRARGIAFEDIDVEASAAGNAEYRALGGRGVPVILVGNQRMDGYSEGSLAGLLKQAGL